MVFRGSNEILGPSHNGNFLGLFELLTKRDPVLNELQNRIIWHKSKQHCFSKYIQNESINLIAREAERILLRQLKQAKYFALILDCTLEISHEEQLTIILRFVQCHRKNVSPGYGECSNYLLYFLKSAREWGRGR